MISGIWLDIISFYKFLLNEFAIIVYSKGEGGKTFLRSLLALKKEAGLPFTRGHILGLPKQAKVRIIKA